MDFISSSIIGGLIYDVVSLGATNYLSCVKVALKNYILSDEEQLLIAQDLSNATDKDKSTKENLENYFETKAENTNKIVNKYIQTHSGTGDNNQNNGNGTFIKEQTIYNTPHKEEIKKH